MTESIPYDASDLRELAGDDIEEVDKHAGLIRDRGASRLFSFLKQSYEPLTDDAPDSFYKTKVARNILSQHGTVTATRALENGSLPVLAYLTGRTDGGGIDIEDWREYEKLLDLFRKEPQVMSELTNDTLNMILFSNDIVPTGMGKSATMYELIDIGKAYHDNLTVLTNNKLDPYRDVPSKWSELVDLIKDIDGFTILGLDEVAQFLQYADQSEGKDVSQTLKRLRHMDCHFIGIGHTGMDIPADIRRQIFLANKQSKKKMDIGYGLTKSANDRMEIADVLMTIENIPAPTVDYGEDSDENELIEIEFGDDEEDEDEKDEFARCNECGRHTKNTSDEEAELIRDSGYCFSHVPDAEINIDDSDSDDAKGRGRDEQDGDETCRVEECRQTILDEDRFCSRHDEDDLS